MKRVKNTENWIIWTVIFLIFVVFLFYPLFLILLKSLKIGPSIKIDNFTRVLSGNGFVQAMNNSFEISAIASLITTFLSFIIAYTINYTNLNTAFKKIISVLAVLPMLIPTITYGFAIIYSFGKQGLFTKLLGKQLFHVYGKNGLLIGYIIYTLPISFMLINNTMKYVDKKFSIVSKIMGDSTIKTFIETVFRPLTGTFAVSFIQCFFLCFTDFGIPASVGGKVEVIASVLYKEMLGSVPNLNNGAVVAVIMLLPSVISILIINYLGRFNVRYNRISVMENEKNTSRDVFCGIFSVLIVMGIIAIFAVIAIVPFVKGWPYNMVFTMDNVNKVIEDSDLLLVYKNSIIVAIITSVLGTILVYGAAIVTDRSSLNSKAKGVIESIASVTNTIPGMVLGISFMLAFTGTSLQNTFIIIIICNLVHFFATPYMMMKNSLSKMNLSWEKTAKLMGDSWIKTIVRIITPNALTSLLEVFSYYFINAMVTVSAVVFLVGARTMVITTKIKELQHFAKFNEIFVLSLLILFTNLLAKIVFTMLVKILERKND